MSTAVFVIDNYSLVIIHLLKLFILLLFEYEVPESLDLMLFLNISESFAVVQENAKSGSGCSSGYS